MLVLDWRYEVLLPFLPLKTKMCKLCKDIVGFRTSGHSKQAKETKYIIYNKIKRLIIKNKDTLFRKARE